MMMMMGAMMKQEELEEDPKSRTKGEGKDAQKKGL